MHISVQFTRLEKEQVKPPVQQVSCPVLIVDSICSCSFLQRVLSDFVTSKNKFSQSDASYFFIYQLSVRAVSLRMG